MLTLEGFSVTEEHPVDDPGWVDISCDLCQYTEYRDWYHGTDGRESVVEDWAYEHMAEYHPRRLRRLGNRL